MIVVLSQILDDVIKRQKLYVVAAGGDVQCGRGRGRGCRWDKVGGGGEAGVVYSWLP
jgi:hypothetical protein